MLHNDQHGTAIVVLAALMNACEIQGKDIKSVKIVILGAGASGLATARLLLRFEIPRANLIVCDSRGVIYEARTEGMNEWKEQVAAPTHLRTFPEAIKDADVFIGLAGKDLLSEAHITSMAPKPIVFALANPNPEINPELAKSLRPDAIVATG